MHGYVISCVYCIRAKAEFNTSEAKNSSLFRLIFPLCEQMGGCVSNSEVRKATFSFFERFWVALRAFPLNFRFETGQTVG